MPRQSDHRLTSLKQPSTRSCDACSACCTVPAISCLAKPAGITCEHLRNDTTDSKVDAEPGRCSIYASRPEPCAGFVCVWLRDTIGLLEEEDRPDRSGLLFTASTPDPQGRQSLEAREVRPRAFQTARAKEILEHAQTLVPVRLVQFEDIGRSTPQATPVRQSA